MSEASGSTSIAVNRRAFYDYAIEDRVEAGLVLTGTEIKSIRQGRVNLRDAYVRPVNGELWLWNAHIAPYDHGNRENHDPGRSRKLLLHRKEIDQLAGKVQAKGYTLIPLRLYLKRGRAKIEVGVARGKKSYDKRDTIAEREANREIQRALKRDIREVTR